MDQLWGGVSGSNAATVTSMSSSPRLERAFENALDNHAAKQARMGCLAELVGALFALVWMAVSAVFSLVWSLIVVPIVTYIIWPLIKALRHVIALAALVPVWSIAIVKPITRGVDVPWWRYLVGALVALAITIGVLIWVWSALKSWLGVEEGGADTSAHTEPSPDIQTNSANTTGPVASQVIEIEPEFNENIPQPPPGFDEHSPVGDEPPEDWAPTEPGPFGYR